MIFGNKNTIDERSDACTQPNNKSGELKCQVGQFHLIGFRIYNNDVRFKIFITLNTGNEVYHLVHLFSTGF